MKKTLLAVYVLLFSATVIAQNPGDTIVVQTFNYNSTSRDTVIQFPDFQGLTFEKIIMEYSIRCKDGLVSSGSQTNKGCGEWDYSCNTYIVDPERVDSLGAKTPSHKITGFSGTTYNYVTQPYYNLYQYTQTTVSQTIITETQSVVGAGNLPLDNVVAANQNSGRSQYLFTQAELAAAGVIAGSVDGIMLTAQTTGTANFFRVRVKATTDTALDAGSVDTTGFTEVYFADYAFASGNNRIQFFAPFNWDGTSNLIFEFSSTNSTTGSPVNISGNQTTFNSGVSGANQYSFNASSGAVIDLPVSNLGGVTSEITVSFWAKGNDGITSDKTSAIFGADANGKKTLNVHLPWNNSRVYFDCGNTGGSYDRIDKPATAAQLSGKWNHWAFTKNTTTGSMKIYLNGVLFHSGGGKTKPIDIESLIFGASSLVGGNIYQGLLDELRIWDKELTQTEIAEWMHKSIDNTHPQFANLVAYYPLNEGTGNTTADMATGNLNGTFATTAIWHYERGRQIDNFFTGTTERPNVTVLQGTYTLSTSNVLVNDSLQAVPNNVKEYQIFPKPGTSQNDSIGLVSSADYWHATQKYVYDGLTGAVISSTPISPDGTINIINLDYVKRSEMRFEIMSFVTPYGIGLDMGMEGETWTFDVTDYTPFLKDSRRILVTMGGQWQEDMDIKFLFIVGTPPHNVLDVQQIWKVNKVNYTQILDETYFAPRQVPLMASGKMFKIRTAITGHGQEGEFIKRVHFINIDGGSKEFSWQVWKTCGVNPIYPQGGTWIYDRAGWCPGMATNVRESDITPNVTPGTSATIDYGLTTASGSSSYIVNNQLVTYGDINHTLDAAVVDVLAPTDKVEYARQGQTCIEPTVRIQNTGATPLTSLTIEYWVNGSSTPETYQWTGSLDFLETEDVVLPSPFSLWDPVSGIENVFHVRVKQPNQGADEYPYNDEYATNFMAPEVLPTEFALWFKTNNRGNENTYKIVDDAGNLLFQRGGMSNNTTYKDTINLPFGCYKLEVLDSGKNGLSFFANNDGTGYIRIWELGGGILKTLQPNFGNEITYNFTIDSPLSVNEKANREQFHLYPNPARDYFVLEGKDIGKTKIFVYDSKGQEVMLNYTFSGNRITVDTGQLATGLYFVNVIYKGRIESKTIVIE